MANVPISNMTATWTDSGTTYNAIKMNVIDNASNAASLLMDLQVGGTSKFKVDKYGQITVGTATTGIGDVSGGLGLYARLVSSYTLSGIVREDIFAVRSTAAIGWSSSVTLAAYNFDTYLYRDNAANTLAQRNATNPQTFRVYNTYTDASNYERGVIDWGTTANTLTIGTQVAGTGTDRQVNIRGANLYFYTGGAARWNIDGSGNLKTQVDNTVDIGGSGSARPRDVYVAGAVVAQSNGGGFFLGGGTDVAILRDAANTLAIRRSTNPQTVNIYNTYTDASNYERAKIAWATNVLQIGTEKGSGGGTARALEFQTDGTTRLTIAATGNTTISSSIIFSNANCLVNGIQGSGGYTVGSAGYYSFSSAGTPTASSTIDAVIKRGGAAGVLTLGNDPSITDFNRLQFGGTTSSFPALKRSSATLQARLADDSDYAIIDCSQIGTTKAYTVATLPAAGTAGRRAYVTDATTPTFLGALTGGGAVVCPVFDNGTAWVAG